MRNSAFVAIGVVFLVLQANLFRVLSVLGQAVDGAARALVGSSVPWLAPVVSAIGWTFATPNLVLPLIVFTGVHEYSLARGAMLAFVLGYAFDLFAAAPIGLFTFASVATFLLARMAGVRLAAATIPTQAALAFLFALAQGVMVLVLIAIFHKDPYVARAMVPRLAPTSVATALFAPLVFRVADRVHQATVTAPRPGEAPFS